MDVSNLPQLPAILAGSALVISQAVFGLLLLFQAPLAAVPGLRASDDTRNAFLRSLVFVLNLAALVGLAWTQNVVIPRADLPALLATAAVAGTVSTGSFFAKKAIANKQQSSAPTVPPLPPDALPVPVVPQPPNTPAPFAITINPSPATNGTVTAPVIVTNAANA